MKPLRFESLSDIDRERLGRVGATTPVYYVGSQWAVTGYGIEELPSEGLSHRETARRFGPSI